VTTAWDQAADSIRAAKAEAAVSRRRRRQGLLAGMRISKKLFYIHTLFSLAFAAILLLTVRPAINSVVTSAEAHELRVALDLVETSGLDPGSLREEDVADVTLQQGGAGALGLDASLAERARSNPGETFFADGRGGHPKAIRWSAERGEFLAATTTLTGARRGVMLLYALIVAALLAVYALIVLGLEAFVLPRQVYRPIRLLLSADDAVQEGRRDEEVIPESMIPADELGEIMRSRNESILKLRKQEAALADALERLEEVANDLKRKNHLLETTRRNMADQDRLVSLGMMSAGLAHELNTPLAVLKGTVERVAEHPRRSVDPGQAALMLRVVNRLERLSESLLDFARARPGVYAETHLRQVVDEAWTLVRIDREAREVAFENRVAEACVIDGDADRLTQVFVNILRNAADAMRGRGRIIVSAERERRDEQEWVVVTCADNGPGIDPDILPRLFDPFTSTRLDANGTGLGLAVAEGIVREHNGLILARNQPSGGAVFEIVLPVRQGQEPMNEESTEGGQGSSSDAGDDETPTRAAGAREDA
jgi:signal transduction histidine kinase